VEKFNVWRFLALITIVFCLGCTGPKPHSGADTAAGADVSGTGNATSGAGTGTGGTPEN
jgi:hypothetical protein